MNHTPVFYLSIGAAVGFVIGIVAMCAVVFFVAINKPLYNK